MGLDIEAISSSNSAILWFRAWRIRPALVLDIYLYQKAGSSSEQNIKFPNMANTCSLAVIVINDTTE